MLFESEQTPFSVCGRGQEPSRGHKFSILENFMSRPNVIPTFRQRRCTNRGWNFVVDGTADKSGEGEIQEFASEFQ